MMGMCILQGCTDVKNIRFIIRLALIRWTSRDVSLVKVRIYTIFKWFQSSYQIEIDLELRSFAYIPFSDFYKRKYVLEHFFQLNIIIIYISIVEKIILDYRSSFW